MRLDYLFTCTPKSSSQFISRLLTSSGNPVSHEMIFGMPGNGVYEDNIIGESSWLAASHLHRIDRNETRVVHITRHPLKVISSLKKVENLSDHMLHSNLYCIYKLLTLPDLKQYEDLDRYLYFYIQWNRYIEKFTSERYRVEDINTEPRKFIEDLGLGIQDESKLWANTNTNSNFGQKNRKYFTWRDVENCSLYKDLCRIAQDYNYS